MREVPFVDKLPLAAATAAATVAAVEMLIFGAFPLLSVWRVATSGLTSPFAVLPETAADTALSPEAMTPFGFATTGFELDFWNVSGAAPLFTLTLTLSLALAFVGVVVAVTFDAVSAVDDVGVD